jgi:hypothetical protein
MTGKFYLRFSDFTNNASKASIYNNDKLIATAPFVSMDTPDYKSSKKQYDHLSDEEFKRLNVVKEMKQADLEFVGQANKFVIEGKDKVLFTISIKDGELNSNFQTRQPSSPVTTKEKVFKKRPSIKPGNIKAGSITATDFELEEID